MQIVENEQLKLDQAQRSIIAENLRDLFKAKKITESKVAQDLNIPVMTIRRLLSGETTDPRVFTLKTLADYFNVTIDNLLEQNESGTYRLSYQAKPLFIPVFDWSNAANYDQINLQTWESWIPVTLGGKENISPKAFALESRPSMYPRFQQGTIFVIDPELTPLDGDIVLINILHDQELTLRELLIDPPLWQLHSINNATPPLNFAKEEHQVIGVVVLTLFYNRKMLK
ncbi:LexA family transcriptional regulator [Legionella impletisoli]|uniref:HTH cro/C1-type domain-containing protein n=1 Tax=Legionella impletisoli TaxID=343510 RepID=A0A917JUI9_9GAMM|nr:LexA family transcriptional regulator [Legionella impletisoli]GGI82721.1 hypothetical protein GCM10007966_09170 [Legionella impletisoli]